MIKKFTIDIDETQLGFGVKAYVGINRDPKLKTDIHANLLKIAEIDRIIEVTGRFDILVTMHSRSLDQMHKMVSEKIGRVEGIQSSESFIEMKSRTKAMPYMPSNTGD